MNQQKHGKMRRFGLTSVALSVAVMAVAAGCGATGTNASTGSKGSTKSSGSVVIDVFNPFSGADAALGTTYTLPGVKAAVAEINADGGILGKQVVIHTTDTRGDPADAVPAAHQLLATNPPNLVVGPTSDTGLATIPIFNQAGEVMLSPAGEPQLDTIHYKYLYRPLPPDSTQGVAMAIAALKEGYTRAALVFGSDSGDQTMVPALIKTFEAHGGKVVFNDALTLDQPSYQTDVAKLVQSKPQVIFTASDAQTAATFLSELKQAGGLTTPIIGSNDVTGQSYLGAVEKAVGGVSVLSPVLQAVGYSSSKTYGTSTYKKYFLAGNNNSATNLNIGINSTIYDAINIVALAMTMAHSDNPKNYVSYITKVSNDTNGVPVSTYAAGLKALKKGDHVFYDGAAGTYAFNNYNYVPGEFAVEKLTAQGSLKPSQFISAQEMNQYSK